MEALLANTLASTETTDILQSIEVSRWVASSLTFPSFFVFDSSFAERNKSFIKILAIACASCFRTSESIKNNFPSFATCDVLLWQNVILYNEGKALKKLMSYYRRDFCSIAASEDVEFEISKKFDWVTKCYSTESIASTKPSSFLVVQAALEVILSFGFTFVLCGLRNDYPELAESLDLITQDKILLRKLICSTYCDVEAADKLSNSQVWHLVKEAIDLETEFYDSFIQPTFSDYSESRTFYRRLHGEGDSLIEELGITGTWKFRHLFPSENGTDILDLDMECE